MITRFSVRRTAALLQVDVIQLPLILLVAAGALAAGALHLEPVLPDETGLGLRWLSLQAVLGHEHGGGALLGHLIDLTVNQDHDETRSEERHQAGGEDVPGLVVQQALTFIMFGHEKRRKRDDRGYYPHYSDHGLNALRRPLQVVADRLCHWPVTVQADGAQMHDGWGAKQHVQSQIESAPCTPKVPVAHNLIGEREGDDQRGHQDVCWGQRDQKEILGRTESPTGQHRYNYQHVTDNCYRNDHSNYQDNERSDSLLVRQGKRCVRAVHVVGNVLREHI